MSKKFRIIKFKSKPILSAKSISKSFDDRRILGKIDLHLNKGEMLGFINEEQINIIEDYDKVRTTK